MNRCDINMCTRRGRDLQATEVAASYAKRDTREGDISISIRVENGFEMLFSSAVFGIDGDDYLSCPGPGVSRDMDDGVED